MAYNQNKIKIVDDNGNIINLASNEKLDDVISAIENISTTGDKNYTQFFSITQAEAGEITVTHNLGKFPSVTVMDTAGTEMEVYVNNLTTNTLTITLTPPSGGVITCN